LPKGSQGNIDWDDIATWDAVAAMNALVSLSRVGSALVPDYDISANAVVGSHLVTADAAAVVAEGIFATPMLAACRTSQVPVVAIWLDRGRWTTWWRRLSRDVREHRKPPRVLWQRGHALRRAEPGLKRDAVDAGFVPMSMRQARTALEALKSAL